LDPDNMLTVLLMEEEKNESADVKKQAVQ